MRERYWVWMVVRLGVGVAIVAWAASYMTAGSGEKEFQKTLDAMKQVHSFRVAFSATASPGTQHNEMLWEVDCDRNVLHYQWHMTDTASPETAMNRDEVHVATQEFDRQSDGSWSKPRFASGRPASWYCGALAQGNDNNLQPQIATMIKRGILQKGDKKTVNGVRCREWLVTLRGGGSGLEHDTVCLGLEDHLPYEMTVDWQHSRSSFSDYNMPISFDMPEAALQPASTSAGAN
jgi:hypothetical protein